MIPPIASRFVAGETADAALERAREVNRDGVGAILNLLGEHYDDRAPADADAATYRDLLSDLAAADLDACISVKPSQVGLDVGEDVFAENIRSIVEHAAGRDQFVWIDMEDHPTVDATLEAYETLAREHAGGVGVCLQANLRRTREDVERLADVPGKIRLVKGAYTPPKAIAYRDKARVNQSYRDLLAYMFEHYEGGIAVGSHDPAMIRTAEDLHEEFGTPFEVQMLMGVRESAQVELAAEYPVWQYVPYGGKWLSYFWRRVLERKENALFAARAVLGR